MKIPDPKDLETLGDGDLLDLLDLVSSEVKRRNGLRPATAGKAAVEVMRTLSELTSKQR